MLDQLPRETRSVRVRRRHAARRSYRRVTAPLRTLTRALREQVLLCIGANMWPLRAPAGNETVVSINFEPIVHQKIAPSERMYIVPAAVSDESGMATMGVCATHQRVPKPAQPAVGGAPR